MFDKIEGNLSNLLKAPMILGNVVVLFCRHNFHDDYPEDFFLDLVCGFHLEFSSVRYIKINEQILGCFPSR